MILIQGWIRLADGEIERLRAAAETMIRATHSEPGCIEYAFAVDVLEPNLLRIAERWKDQAALDAHFASAHMAAFQKAIAGAKIVGSSAMSYTGSDERKLMG
ncbi:MAG: antibiotic biosynthesis monooxygenase [Deltaproteobacteria bacterium]|nr:antibiotic biosynthesis monooxygenase [Deltaproteobacteria bacterium]